ncbi:Sec1-like protein [Staphylotrichum tortipilum]|uniref:Sec1-like protein n=1 Tax=Staphylotrichum tortipilum TaxID=2831512 RepID=A0AAN6MTH2_9PEZI|nr:Sec1-like protein [Staphylotrichum longicolle]
MAPRAGFDTEQIHDKARKDLLHLLEGVRGKKNLVIEKDLAGPIGAVVKASTLRDYGVDNFFFLENKNTDTSQRNVVFIARGESTRNAHAITDQIIRIQRESQSPHEFHIFWVPRRTLLSDKVLEEAGVLGDTNVAELPLYFFPLEDDLLSLELNDSFRDLYLAKDPTPIFLLARALMGIQQKHGLFPRIIGKGDNAKRVADLLARMRQELLAGEDTGETDKPGLSPSTTIENVIIIDREVDPVTPLLTQLTYEGLLDEVFGIQNNQADVDSTIVGAAPQAAGPGSSATTPANSAQSRKRKIQLDGSDALFAQLRDANFAIVGGLLNKMARRLQSDYESRHSSKTPAELSEFVRKLPGYQAEQQRLKIHTGMAEEIIKYTRTENFNKLLEVQQNLAAGADPSSQFDAIEELIARDTPLPQVLRQLCIYSCISGGIKAKELDHFRRLVLQGYGYQHLVTLHNLERLQLILSRASPLAGMIPMTATAAGAQGSKTNYTYLRKQLRLIVDEVNEHDPNDIAYVYSGYAPLSVRLVQCVLQKQYLASITRGAAAGGGGGAQGAAAGAAGGGVGGGAQGWRGFDDAVKHARGATFDEVQKGEDKAVKARALLSSSSGGGAAAGKKTVFVVFVGGVTFTEIAALRFLARQEEGRREIVICTTSIISGNRMMEAAIETETFEKSPPRAPAARSAIGPWTRSACGTPPHRTRLTPFLAVLSCCCRSCRAAARGKGLLRGARDLDSRRLTRTTTSLLACSSNAAAAAIKPPSPPASTLSSDPEGASKEDARRPADANEANSPEDIAPEIVVWTEDMDAMMVDSPESATPTTPAAGLEMPEVEAKIAYVLCSSSGFLHVSVHSSAVMAWQAWFDNAWLRWSWPSLHQPPPPPPHPHSSIQQPGSHGHALTTPRPPVPSQTQPIPVPPPETLSNPIQTGTPNKESSSLSSLSSLSDQFELSSLAPSTSSKATTPVDVDSSREAALLPKLPRVSRPSDSPRRKWDVRPKYAMQCVAAAEASRLNPYSLHQEEYLMLRDHISNTQVTTYLNIRNGILRLWVRNPQIPVTREEAVGCAKDPRWFDVASVSFEWLVRRGYINFGCVEVQSSRKHAKQNESAKGKRKTVVVIGAGMAGLGCARQLEGLFLQYAKKFRSMGEEPPRVVVLEGRDRIGGRVYSRAFKSKPKNIPPQFEGKRFTAEMGGMIITGFERGNPLNILLRGQLGLAYHLLRPETTLYDSSGKPVDIHRDQLVENLYNDCLDRVSEYKFKQPTSKLIEGNRDLIDEGKDSSAETHKTIRQAEESAAAQPYAPPVSEQNIAPQVNLVPVSTDRATGKIHTEPGTPGAIKAAHKAKMIGWTLKQGVSEEADLDIEPATKEPGATLGSVTDRVIAQYRDLLDLTAQDFRLMNWHIANLEYSNATNYHQLSLQGWDIDAGNEWEGSHSMVVGGYQSVPRGLMHLPTPLDVKQKSPVNKITYTSGSLTGPATVTCEDGFTVEADYVVSTIPLGVLKHGNVSFEPPLPTWKSDVVGRLGFGVLNKVILVYKEPFWDEDRDIFGVLRNPTNRHSLDQKDYAPQRGRFFQWFNVTRTSGLPVLLALMAGDAGFDTEQTCNDDLVAEATTILRSVYGSRVPNPIEAVVTRWASDKFARGSYSSAGPDMEADDYDAMARPVGNLFFAGEHTCGTHPATVHGAYLSGLRAAAEVLDALLGPIPIPVPLILPKDPASLLGKRKASTLLESTPASTYKPSPAEIHETAVWEHILSQLGPRPLPPPKPATNAYIFYSKTHYEDARARLEAARRPGGGGTGSSGSRSGRVPSANEVRVMSARMWRDATEEERRPFVEMAEGQKRAHAEALGGFKERVGEWDRRAERVRGEFERGNPPPSSVQVAEGEGRRRGERGGGDEEEMKEKGEKGEEMEGVVATGEGVEEKEKVVEGPTEKAEEEVEGEGMES